MKLFQMLVRIAYLQEYIHGEDLNDIPWCRVDKRISIVLLLRPNSALLMKHRDMLVNIK